MVIDTTELNKLTDEQVDTEFKTLKAKAEATPEDKEKLEGLKEERQTRYDKRIKVKDSERLAALNRAEQAEKALEEERRLRKEAESKPKEVSIVNDTVEHDGKKFYTDKALRSMVEAGELNTDEAYAHQQERQEAKITERVETRYKSRNNESDEKRVRAEDAAIVAKDYPQFDSKNKDHDPEDPLFKKADELWREGYFANPRGLTLAINRAKEILGHTDKRPDLSDEFSVGRNKSGAERGSAASNVSLSEQEKDFYVRMYVMGNVMNPKTNKTYTEAEAIAKGIANKAKSRK